MKPSGRVAPCKKGVRPLTPSEAAEHLVDLPGWTLDPSATRLTRRFRFPDFAAAFAFVTRIAALAEAANHHPDLAFGWGWCEVTWWTHVAGGLTGNDFRCAAQVSALLPT